MMCPKCNELRLEVLYAYYENHEHDLALAAVAYLKHVIREHKGRAP